MESLFCAVFLIVDVDPLQLFCVVISTICGVSYLDNDLEFVYSLNNAISVQAAQAQSVAVECYFAMASALG